MNTMVLFRIAIMTMSYHFILYETQIKNTYNIYIFFILFAIIKITRALTFNIAKITPFPYNYYRTA